MIKEFKTKFQLCSLCVRLFHIVDKLRYPLDICKKKKKKTKVLKPVVPCKSRDGAIFSHVPSAKSFSKSDETACIHHLRQNPSTNGTLGSVRSCQQSVIVAFPRFHHSFEGGNC